MAAGPRRQGAASEPLWPVISPAEIVGLMRGVRFFRDAELPPEAYAEVAGWFEQCHFEAYRVLGAEGSPCNS